MEYKIIKDTRLYPEDIRLYGDQTEKEKSGSVTSQYLANRLRYSVRAYLSMLYLRIPNHFSMLLRGGVIEYHNIANDAKHPKFIVYKPHSPGNVEGSVVTTIGVLNDAPLVNTHVFKPAKIDVRLDHPKSANLLQENKDLQRRCLELEKRQEELNNKLIEK